MRRVARQLGRYHVLDRIAFGGMAEIFRALTFQSDGSSRIVAIKQVLPHYAEDHEFIDMLVDEAKLVSMLHHQNIAEIYEVGYVDGVYFLSMELVTGKDLRAVLERCRARGVRVPFEVSAYIMAEALAGLDTAHRLLDPEGNPAGLVHRDFSPSNILIAYDGEVKICDFGIAKANFSRIQTKTGVIKGKVKYMSPEQAFGRKLDHRSDVFSAGSCLYEMLTSEPPFMAKNEIDLIFMVRDARITPPRQRVAEIPEDLERAVFKSMTRARGARYQSAAEFRQSLLLYLRNRGAGNWRAELGRFITSLYAEDIGRERAALASFDLDVGSIAADYGRNLIADVLGANAPYTKFNAHPTKAQPAPSERPADLGPVHSAETRMLEAASLEDPATEIKTNVPGLPVDQQDTAAVQLPGASDEDRTLMWERPPTTQGERQELPEWPGAPPRAQAPPPSPPASASPPLPEWPDAAPPANRPVQAPPASASPPLPAWPDAPVPARHRQSTLRGAPPPRVPPPMRPAETTEETTLDGHGETIETQIRSEGGAGADARGLVGPDTDSDGVATRVARPTDGPLESEVTLAVPSLRGSHDDAEALPTRIAGGTSPRPASGEETIEEETVVASGSSASESGPVGPDDSVEEDARTQIATPGGSLDDTSPHLLDRGRSRGR